MAERGVSLILDYGENEGDCGYCKGAAGHSQSHGMQAYRLTVYDYQDLIDQGWRRAGKYMYRMDNAATCCRHYTIRLPVAEFAPSKSQRRLLRRWERFLAGEDAASGGSGDGEPEGGGGAPAQPAGGGDDSGGRKRGRPASANSEGGAAAAADEGGGEAAAAQQQAAQRLLQRAADALAPHLLGPHAPGGGAAAGAMRVAVPPPKLRKQLPPGTLLTSPSALGLAAAAAKRAASSSGGSSGGGGALSAEAIAAELAAGFNALAEAEGLAVAAAAARGHVNFSAAAGAGGGAAVGGREPPPPQQQQQQQQQQRSPGADTLVARVSTDGPPAAPPPAAAGCEQPRQQKQGRPPPPPGGGAARKQQQQQQQPQQQESVPAAAAAAAAAVQRPRRLEVTLVPSRFSQESFQLYKRYQMAVHKDKEEGLTPAAYSRFLVDSPLEAVPPGKDPAAPSCGYGSFHQEYRLDGRLVVVGVVDVLPRSTAGRLVVVGVVDVLPRCLSSVYLYWDPTLAPLAPGKLSALLEIEWLAYYYMGFYIHTCPKMRYKADYAPSELLCPEALAWVRIDPAVLAALDQQPFVALSRLPGARTCPNLALPAPAAAAAAAPPAPAAAAPPAPAAAAAAPAPGPAAAGAPRRRGQQAAGGAAGGGAAGAAGVGGQAVLLPSERRPFRWRMLVASGLLPARAAAGLERQIAAWRALVGPAADTTVYMLGGAA
ncbi:MAG: arginine-tRNA-protein transferase [Monoraphidium minutum]|nr:MAG: arginine-tRNA-protein transferase [Monoraphidium minutum]